MKENRYVENKAEITNSFLKTVSAFSNFEGGRVFFGVSDDESVIGIDNPDQSVLDIENRINDSISPKPDYSLSINRRNNVITLTVQEGKYKPYLYKGKAYRRSDTASIEVDGVELKRLTLDGSNIYFEELPCNQKKLSFAYLEEQLKDKLGIVSISEDVLRTLGFYTDDRKYNNAAALFSDKNAFYGTDIARFGNSISEVLDRETIAGVSVLKQYDGAVSAYRRYYQYEKIDGIERKSVDIVPETAYREAVANALVHRFWDEKSHVRISMYADRIEIASPGGLPRGLTREEYINGSISNLRNPIIGNVFFRLHYIEMFGTGIKRIIESYENCSVKPEFKITDNSITIVLPALTHEQKISSDGQKVLDVLGENRLLSSSEIATDLGWSKDKAIRVLNVLRESGAIKVTGNGRGTKYSSL